MRECNDMFMSQKYVQLNQQEFIDFKSAYKTASVYKEEAFRDCLRIARAYNAYYWSILGHNTFTFSFGFLGYKNGKQIFGYITPFHRRFMYTENAKIPR